MAREFEVAANPRFRNMRVFLVHMRSRMPHIHPELEIGFVLQGSTHLRVGTESFLLNGRDGYLINPLEPHEFGFERQDAVILAVQISPRIFDAFFSDIPTMRYRDSAFLRGALSDERVYKRLLGRCVELARLYLGQPPHYEFDCFALTGEILAMLNRELPGESLTAEAWRPIRQKLERILSVTDYIDANFQRKLLLEEIARREGLTMPYLSHLFSETLGMGFQEYLKKKRFEHARSLILETNRSILDISLESGFSDTRYMVRMFEEEFGCTPREYRKKISVDAPSDSAAPGNVQELLRQEDAMRLLEHFIVEIAHRT